MSTKNVFFFSVTPNELVIFALISQNPLCIGSREDRYSLSVIGRRIRDGVKKLDFLGDMSPSR